MQRNVYRETDGDDRIDTMEIEEAGEIGKKVRHKKKNESRGMVEVACSLQLQTRREFARGIYVVK